MKALFLTRYGLSINKNVKFFEREIDDPKRDEVRIETYAAGLNPIDQKIIFGLALIIMKPKRPFPLGFDLAGIVVKKGDAVTDLNIGDKVYSKVPWDQMGTISEQILVRANMVALKPKNTTFAAAAGLPLVACTVLDSFQVANIKKGSKILIHAGSGGIGTFAIQYAKYLGAYVYTTTSTKNVALVKSLGADVVIDYKKQDYRKIVKDLDVVYDTLGRKYTRQALSVIKKGGKIISIAGHHDDATLKKVGISKFFRILFQIKGSILMYRMKRKGVFYKHVWSYPNKKKLNYIRVLIESEKIKPVNDKEFPFEKAAEALAYLRTNRAKGKVTIKIKEAVIS
ncbi:NADP-dependent oxidoreductase [Putridiphycobacter roseus]|uniref:NADP-dependent oxidoreductase n=1 Tax=Putridiphycobacter roseus TaxID=2219161 RepID=A0A2W1NDK6_9FLAO|nr:NADP-dependent oxidoreductase [Putridiphycobacter roseus]PZE16156.1 NADP-dependent oxidoreductase [Putridiphycobacter roseus]